LDIKKIIKMKKIKKFKSFQEKYDITLNKDHNIYLEEIEELLLDFKDEGIRCEVFPSSYSEPGFQIYINLDINLYNYVKEGEDKSQSFNEYSDKMTLVLNNMKEFFKRLQDIDFNILLCELISGNSNDYFMIKIKKIL
jgi:hypothetical protein